MLRTLAVVLFVAYCVGGQHGPRLWGSRIVTQNSGSVNLDVDYKPVYWTPDFVVVPGNGMESYEVFIKDGVCIADSGNVWSSPCSYNNGTASITVADVTAQKRIHFSQLPVKGKDDFIHIFFAPGCIFPESKEGEVVVKPSIPLSRFVQGQQYVPLEFAVKGKDSQVQLWKNGGMLCGWRGQNLYWERYAGLCINEIRWSTQLAYDRKKNMRVFRKQFPVPETDKGRDYIEWSSGRSFFTITVDNKQQGEPPEVAACKTN